MGFVFALFLAAASPPPELVPAPVTAVTVFSDRAKVTRQAQLPLSKGVHRLTFAALPPGAQAGSISLDAAGATVQRVEVHRGNLGELAASEVDKALKELDDARAAVRALTEQRVNRESERALLLRLRPAAPSVDAKGQPRALETAGWRDAMAFFDARLKANDAALADLDGKDVEARKRLKVANEKAALLANGNGEVQPLQVDAVLECPGGTATLSLSYLVNGARWTPAYDVRYRPGDAKVEVGFAAFVSQQTGEDWPASQLLLSTAVPSTLRDVPRLTVWKIGERDRFIPTSVAKPRPSQEPQAQLASVSDEQQQRARLLEALAPPPDFAQVESEVEALKEQVFRTRARLELLDETVLGGTVNQIHEGKERVAKLEQDARSQRDVVKMNGLKDKLRQLEGLERVADDARRKSDEAKAAGDTARAAAEDTKVAVAGKKAHELAYSFQDDGSGMRAEALEVQSAPEPTLMRAPGAVADKLSSLFSFGGNSDRGPPAQVGFVTPRAWQLPSFAPELPAALAGGYDFLYSAARPEALKSAPEARRVPLFRKTFAAEPELTLVPGLSSSAYLMAKVVNESDKPLLRGAANLYVGADLVGQAVVDTTSVGEKTRLPLGIDDAVKVERKVELVTATKGLISKDDVSTYQVRIDILSAQPQQVAARVLDQIPLAGAEKVEVKLISSEPAASLDKDLGLLEWSTTLAPNQKRTLTFSYSVTRPKGERLQQWSP
jgi:hypothetical protein